jgi:taurine dioxygenase
MNEAVCRNSQELRVIPTGGALGAEIRGVDLSGPLLEATVRCLWQALLDHCVIFFRDQEISEEQQVHFTSYFDRSCAHVRQQPDRPVNEVFVISNVEENGQAIGALGNSEVRFHSDLSYLKKPGTLSFLYAVEVPRVGGATQWVNCYAAYEALDKEMQCRLKGLRAVHRHYIESQNPVELVDHPVVRTHSQTGRKSLYVGPHLTKSIVGLSQTESREWLDQLFEHIQQPQFIWTHDWKVGDLVVWDNRPTLHRREPFPPTERRIMKRTQIFGDEVPYE